MGPGCAPCRAASPVCHGSGRGGDREEEAPIGNVCRNRILSPLVIFCSLPVRILQILENFSRFSLRFPPLRQEPEGFVPSWFYFPVPGAAVPDPRGSCGPVDAESKQTQGRLGRSRALPCPLPNRCLAGAPAAGWDGDGAEQPPVPWSCGHGQVSFHPHPQHEASRAGLLHPEAAMCWMPPCHRSGYRECHGAGIVLLQERVPECAHPCWVAAGGAGVDAVLGGSL